MSSALSLPWRQRLLDLLETPEALKLRRVGFHVVRAAKKFLGGVANAAWISGTTTLVLVMPLVFEIDRDQQNMEFEAGMMPK